MSGETDEVREYARRRLIQMSEWQQVLLHGTDAEKRALATSLGEADLLPALSTLDEDEEVVRLEASHHRQVLALDELQEQIEQAILDGDIDLAATLLDLMLNAEGEID